MIDRELIDLDATPRILIVDDDNFMRQFFRDALDRAQFVTTTVADGAAAIRCLKEDQYDLVVLDLFMPGLNGFEICRILRALPSCRFLPVLIVTSSDDSKTISAAFEAGATDFITKPIKPELLAHRVRYMLRAHRNTQELAESQKRLATAQKLAQMGNWIWDPPSDTFHGSEETCRILGVSDRPQKIPMTEFLLLLYPGDREPVQAGLERVRMGRSQSYTFETRVMSRQGSIRVARLQAFADDAGSVASRVMGTLQDITEMKQAEDRLQVLREAIDCLPIGIGITICDVQGKIIYSNAVEAEMHGYEPGELIGKNANILAPRDLEQHFLPGKMRKIGLWRRESTNVRKNGEEFPVQLSSIAVRSSEGRCIGIVTACEDITSRKDTEKQIAYLAYYDPLTGLGNRLTLMTRLPQTLALARREGRQFALLFLDLDNFKNVNDTRGHDFGDKLLKEVTERLLSYTRESDTLVRLGGDEFVIVLASIEDHEGAAYAASRLQSVFAAPFLIEGQKFYSSASIGIALYPEDGADTESLLKSADAAMYHAKSEGKSNFQFFSSDMNNRIMRRVSLENSMRQGIERGEFFLHYQPKWDLRSARMTGVEALLRWESADLGSVPPAEFIPIAEMSGLMLDLGEIALKEACLQAKKWGEDGEEGVKVAVNISGKQFKRPDFLQTVWTMIQKTGVDPRYLEFELTESVVMEKAERTIETLRALKEMGVSLSIDDFGTGYSSLSYLKHFPMDTVKIDRSFIADLSVNPDGAAIAEAVIFMAHSLNLKVVAEGVETEEQLDFLVQRHCDEAQGFFLAEPMPAKDVTCILKGAHGALPHKPAPRILALKVEARDTAPCRVGALK